MELERADGLVNSAYRRVQELDRFSRSSSPLGKAELATIALQALAELGAPALQRCPLVAAGDDHRVEDGR